MDKSTAIKKIVRIESKELNTLVYYTNGNVEIVSNSIDEVEREFASLGFKRVHPCHLVNGNYLRGIRNVSQPFLLLNDGTMIPTSKKLLEGSDIEDSGSTSFWTKITRLFTNN
ncbi:LytTR family transcriptional regulator [Labilibacter sediminis]|nr:LytTR family transcriptional regulator [Labilibacter sediminis]